MDSLLARIRERAEATLLTERVSLWQKQVDARRESNGSLGDGLSWLQFDGIIDKELIALVTSGELRAIYEECFPGERAAPATSTDYMQQRVKEVVGTRITEVLRHDAGHAPQ